MADQIFLPAGLLRRPHGRSTDAEMLPGPILRGPWTRPECQTEMAQSWHSVSVLVPFQESARSPVAVCPACLPCGGRSPLAQEHATRNNPYRTPLRNARSNATEVAHVAGLLCRGGLAPPRLLAAVTRGPAPGHGSHAPLQGNCGTFVGDQGCEVLAAALRRSSRLPRERRWRARVPRLSDAPLRHSAARYGFLGQTHHVLKKAFP